jgi:lysophospholipase L1-like esterase
MRLLCWVGALIVCTGCAKEPVRLSVLSSPSNTISAPAVANTWLALGDSYTIGQGVAASERYPAQAVELLLRKNIRVDTLTYLATTGWTTSDLQQALDAQKPAAHKVVTLLIGVNDQYRRWDTAGYRVRFRDLLQRSIVLAKGNVKNVCVLSIPDYSVTPYARSLDTARIRKEIDQFNQINKDVTLQIGVAYLDITGLTREARIVPALISGDGLHPSGMDYRRWADRLLPFLEGRME